MLNKFVLIICSLFSGQIIGQESKCQCSKIDLTKFDNFLENNEFDNAKSYLTKIKTANSVSCEALKLQLLSEFFTIGAQYNLDSVKFYLDKENKLLPKLNPSSTLRMEYYSNLSIYFLLSNNLQKGNENLLKSMVIAEKLKDYEQLYLLYSNLSILYSHLSQTDKMLTYNQKVRAIAYKSKDKTQIIKRLSFIADTYNNYYSLKKHDKYKDSVYTISKEILSLSKNLKYDYGLFRSYELMHNKPFYEGNYVQSLKYLDSAFSFIKEHKSFTNIQSKATIYRKRHEIFLSSKQLKNALICTDSILKFAEQSNQEYTLLSAYKRKFETYKALKDDKNSLLFFEKFTKLKDSIYGKEKLAIVTELEEKYNKVKNEKKIEKLSQEKKILFQNKTIDSLKINLLMVGVILTVSIILIVIILFRQKALKQIQLQNDLELKLNRSRINPHFFFNSLTAFQAILIKEENKKKLLLNFATFSKFMRQILESSYTDFISIEKEIKILENYIRLQLLRNEQKFSYNIIISDEIYSEDTLIPAMILQPLVENAIEHGFKTYHENGKLDIKFTQHGENLEIQIIDNGIYLLNEEKQKENTSRSGQITKDRFELLSKKFQKEFSLKLDILSEGTKVTLKLPIIHENFSSR